MLCTLYSDPPIPRELPDMCETCESVQRDGSMGHHTFLACGWGYGLSNGICLWYCSPHCFLLSSLPTLDSAPDVWEYALKGRCDIDLFAAWLRRNRHPPKFVEAWIKAGCDRVMYAEWLDKNRWT